MSRGFARGEYEQRLARAQERMAAAGLGALMLTDEADFRYFSGFLTRFWESPSRPWFLIVPAHGAPCAVVPAIGAALMAQTWIDDIRTWPAPRPDDDGVNLLAEALCETGGPVGVPSGHESRLRMPLADYARVQSATGLAWRDDAGIVAALRAVKSAAEIDKIAETCGIAGRAFARMGEIAGTGIALSSVFRDFQRLLLEEGADHVPYVAGGAGPGGYADVISPAADTPLCRGDVLMLDTGALRDGYFCDFNRNFAIGTASPQARAAHARLVEATMAGFAQARPGARACDLWAAMGRVLGTTEDTGRLGHGLGMQLTEGISLTSRDMTVLRPGMVITLEPVCATTPGRIMVHEENIRITEAAPVALSPFAAADLPVL